MNNANEIVISVNALLWVCGTIITIGGAAAVIAKMLTPFKKLKERLKTVEDSVKELQGYQKSDHSELQRLETGVEKICKCTLAITDHELTGNSIKKLQEARDEMQDYLIKK